MGFDRIKSFAKINLSLNITGKNSYLHKIESIISFISLHDVISIETIKLENHEISFYGEFSKNIEKHNSIYKLLKILDDKNLLNNQKFRIRIKKKIPLKSGLGGGSMNAASILRYFIKKKIVNLNYKEITKICKSIGSDVIIGINPSSMILTSKNQLSLFSNIKKVYVLVVKPNFGCSTKKIYSQVKTLSKPQLNNPTKKMFNLDFLKKLDNKLEEIVLLRYSHLSSIKHYLENLSKNELVRMTGSGSALVVYFKSKKACDNAMRQFKREYKNHWCISSKTI